MSTELNYQINYGTMNVSPEPTRPDPAAPLFASEDGVVASLSNNECIFQTRRTGDTHVMTYQVLQALDQCREFRTLDEHIARIQTTISGLQTQRDNVHRVLQSLAERGLLVSDRAFLDRLASTPTVATAPAPRAVFIRACNRPAELERLLRSLADYERRFRASRRDSTSVNASLSSTSARLLHPSARAWYGTKSYRPSAIRAPDMRQQGGGTSWTLARR